MLFCSSKTYYTNRFCSCRKNHVLHSSATGTHAPEKTDCLTAIHYIFKKALNVNIPLTFIGDMPRQLLSLENWSPIESSIENAQCGDIFFTRNKNKPKLISHVALIIEPDKIFHCTPILGKAVIQSKEEFFSFYEQKLPFRKMIPFIKMNLCFKILNFKIRYCR